MNYIVESQNVANAVAALTMIGLPYYLHTAREDSIPGRIGVAVTAVVKLVYTPTEEQRLLLACYGTLEKS